MASWNTSPSVCRRPDRIADTPWRTGEADQPREEDERLRRQQRQRQSLALRQRVACGQRNDHRLVGQPLQPHAGRIVAARPHEGGVELAAHPVSLSATLANYDAWACGVNVHAYPVTGPLDLNLGHTCALETFGHELADLSIFLNVVLVALARLSAVSEPPGPVLGGDTQSVPVRVYLLSHYRARPFVLCAVACSRSATTTVMWLVRLRMRPARPCARGRNRFMVGP